MSEPAVEGLLSVAEAIRIIDAVAVPTSQAIDPAQPRRLRLSHDVHSDRDYPPFDKALMDGFAVRSADVAGVDSELEIVGEIAAGAVRAQTIAPGTCVAIMTGAPLPPGADAVLPIEVATETGSRVRFSRIARPGDAVSRRGSDLRRGERVLPAGVVIGAAQVGALVQVGAASLLPRDLPGDEKALSTHVLVTGDEIVDEMAEPGPTQMRDVNGPMLASLLTSLHTRCGRSRVGDDQALTREAIDRLAREVDVLFVTGGMSMGKYDYVPRVLIELGFELKITKLRIKPGKPFVFAVRERPGRTDIVFGLPGNPVSGFCCTVRLASRLLARLRGRAPEEPVETPLLAPLGANGPREFYQPAIIEPRGVMPLAWKGSADVFTLAQGNALVVRPIDEGPRAIGERVRVMRYGT